MPTRGVQQDSAGGGGLGRSGWVPPGLRRDRRPDRHATPKSKFLSPYHLTITLTVTAMFSDGSTATAVTTVP